MEFKIEQQRKSFFQPVKESSQIPAQKKFHRLKLGNIKLPCSCVICDSLIFNAISLCGYCQSKLPWLQSKCIRCSIPLNAETETQLCGRCRLNPPIFDSCNTVFIYQQPIRNLIANFKYNAAFADGRVLTSLLTDRFVGFYKHGLSGDSPTEYPECLIPVPLHPVRLKQRGFNQAVEISRMISRYTGVVVNRNLIIRTRNTPTQTGLGIKQRSANLKGAFKLTENIASKELGHVALIDDVITTMTTVSILSKLLKSSGISRVDIWAIARSVQP